jgi:hypothetical protein
VTQVCPPPPCPTLCPPSASPRVVVKDELSTLLGHPGLGRGVPLLFLANKKDLPTALSPVEIAQVGGRGGAVFGAPVRHGGPYRRPRLRAGQPSTRGPACAERSRPSLPAAPAARQALQLEDIRLRPWHIAPSDALTGDGLDAALDWLADKLLRR